MAPAKHLAAFNPHHTKEPPVKSLFAICVLSLASLSASAAEPRVYGLHLFFDEKDNVDVLTLSTDAQGRLTGDMHVPNDFDTQVLNLEEKEGTLSFDLPVPKNSSRPVDLMFHYEGRYFAGAKEQLAGFVTLKGEQGFVASFVAFLRKI